MDQLGEYVLDLAYLCERGFYALPVVLADEGCVGRHPGDRAVSEWPLEQHRSGAFAEKTLAEQTIRTTTP